MMETKEAYEERMKKIQTTTKKQAERFKKAGIKVPFHHIPTHDPNINQHDRIINNRRNKKLSRRNDG